MTDDDDGGLVVLWGRRRIGKTRLLLRWIEHAGGVYWVADESAASIQRRSFADALATQLPGFADVEYRDWAALFDRIARDARHVGWRGPLVIDELPHVLGSSPELPTILQRFVDHGARTAGIVLALSGSSQRMMQGLVLDANAPLYGRARESIKLQPLGAAHLVKALAQRDAAAAIEAWSAWGGVPRYWELAAKFRHTADAVDALVLDPHGPLHDEPPRMLLEESPPAVSLRPLLDAIGAGANRVSEIAGRIGQPATSLARPLARLQELELVVREIPFGEPEQSSKRALYKLADPFLGLWFRLVAPRRSMLLQVSAAARRKIYDNARAALCSVAWEDMSRRAVPLLHAKLGRAYGPAKRYWAGNGPVWDLVADATDGTLLVGEAKWSDHASGAHDVDRAVRAAIAKGAPPVSRRAASETQYVLFVPKLARNVSVPRHVRVVDAEAVVRVLT